MSANARAADEVLASCASVGVPSISAVQPVHVTTWIKAATRELAGTCCDGATLADLGVMVHRPLLWRQR